MDISGSSLHQPVNFYPKNTGNNINYSINGDNHSQPSNVFAQEMFVQSGIGVSAVKTKRKSKNKRLNTVDTDYLPEDTDIAATEQNSENFFVVKNKLTVFGRFTDFMEYLVSITPLVNYFFLKNKEKNIEKTVITLNDISQNVDELMNTTVPFGEETALYDDLAKNLTKAANIIGEANKKNW